MFLALYGMKVNIGEAVFISIFSMAVVFVVLLIISYMIDVVALVISKSKKSVKIASKINEDSSTTETKMPDDTVAVIAASIAAYIGSDVNNLRIKKIRRVKNSSWRI